MVAVAGDDVVCDYNASLKEMAEYLDSNGAYDLFDVMLKELLTKQPDDPLQCMIDCLKTELPSGPLRVFVVSASGADRSQWCRKISEKYGLRHISPGELLRQKGVDVDATDFVDDKTVIAAVESELLACEKQMQGWVLDGFPRTNLQASFLREKHIVPSNVFLLNATEALIKQKNAAKAAGDLPGKPVAEDVLDAKLKLHFRHGLAALEAYMSRTKQIDLSSPEDAIWSELQKHLETRPYSKAPKRAPRTVLLGPPGSEAKAFAEKLAEQLGGVMVDGSILSKSPGAKSASEGDDLVGAVFERLKQNDCVQAGWVLTNFPNTEEQARALVESEFAPIRVIALDIAEQTCVRRLGTRSVDPVTGKVWTSLPKSDVVRKRLQRNPFEIPEYVRAKHAQFMSSAQAIVGILAPGGIGRWINADQDAHTVADEIGEFVERPLPLELLNV